MVQKVVDFEFRGRPVGDWKVFSVDLTVNRYFFRFRGGQDSERTGKGSNFYEQCQIYKWSLTALQLRRYKIPLLLPFGSFLLGHDFLYIIKNNHSVICWEKRGSLGLVSVLFRNTRSLFFYIFLSYLVFRTGHGHSRQENTKIYVH